MVRTSKRVKRQVKSYKESNLYPDIDDRSKKDEDADEPVVKQKDLKESAHSDEDVESCDDKIVTPTNRNRKTRHYRREDDSEVDEEEEEEESMNSEESLVVRTRRKRGRPKGSQKNSCKKRGARNYGPLKDRTCPYCKKVFSIITGLAYHIEHQVCLKVKPEKGPGLAPFPILKPGEEFVTQYGVVRVVKDDRAGDDYGETVLDSNIETEKKNYRRQMERMNERRNNLTLYQAKLSRKRKERFLDFYRDHCDKQISDVDFAKAIFQEYIPEASSKQVLEGLFTLENLKSFSITAARAQNPMEPKDCYAERIVECELIKDERLKIVNLDDELEEDGRFTKLDVASSIIAKAQERNVPEKSRFSPCHESGLRIFIKRNLLVEPYNKDLFVYTCADCGRVFNTRVGCKQHTDERKCIERGEKAKNARQQRLQEIEESLEIEEIGFKSSSRRRVKDSRKRGRKANKVYPSWMVFYPDRSPIYPEVFEFLKFKRGSNNSKFIKQMLDELGPGRKRRRKSRSKSSGISDIKSEDGDDSASIQDSLLETPTFPRHSRGAAQKARAALARYHDDDEHSQAIDADEDFYVGGNDDEQDSDFNSEQMPPLPQSSDADQDKSFPALNNASSISGRVSAASTTQLQADASITSSNVEEASSKVSTKKSWMEMPRKRVKVQPSVDSSKQSLETNPLIVDIRPLAEEIRAGRYPSMKVYNGEHLKICFICKTEGDDVHHCEFCSNSEHLNCLTSKLTLHNLDPEDEFMCHICIQTCMSRRNRAEKRRIEKLTGTDQSDTDELQPKSQMKWNESNKDIDAFVAAYSKCPSGGPGGLVCCEHCSNAYSRLLTETSKEIEIQTVSSIGREVTELIELLNDAQTRLKQVVDVTNLNDIRRSLLKKSETTADKRNA